MILDHINLLEIGLAGCIAGVTADLSLHSLDTIKVNLQANNKSTYTNFYKSILKSNSRSTLITKLYRGYQPVLFGSVICSSIYFMSYEHFKSSFSFNNNSLNHLTAAIVGEILISGVYVPTELVKSRMQLSKYYYNNSMLKSNKPKLASTLNVIKDVYRTDGIKGFFKGYLITMLRDIPQTSIMFVMYEFMRDKYCSYKSINNREMMSAKMELFMGFIAGGVSGGLTTPIDHLKTVIQTSTINNNNINKIKLTSFFSGLWPRVIWSAYQSAILFLVYEEALNIIQKIVK